MSQPPQGPEYYSPPAPAPIPPPPSISDAAVEVGSTGGVPYVNPPGFAAPPQRSAPQGFAIASLVLGIVGSFTGWIPVWGIAVGITALVLGIVAIRKRQSKGMAIPGMVLGIISALMSIAVLAVVLIEDDLFDRYDPADYYQVEQYYHGDMVPLSASGSGPSSLKLSEYAVQESTSPGVWWFVVILDNPNAKTYMTSEIEVRALAADGTVLADWTAYRYVAPGKTAIVGTFYDVEGEIASLEVVGPPDEALFTEPVLDSALEVGDLSVKHTDWSTEITGRVTSTYEKTRLGVEVAVVARDGSGAIIAGGDRYVTSVDGGGSEEFTVYLFDGPFKDATFEAYVWAY